MRIRTAVALLAAAGFAVAAGPSADLVPMPVVAPGTPNVDLPAPIHRLSGNPAEGPDKGGWGEARRRWAERKGKTMVEVRALIAARYDLSGKATPGIAMSREKPVPLGPVARETKEFPYLPLPHPVHSLGHFVFPDAYLRMHPDLDRVDSDFDIPDAYLPEFPPPLHLVGRPELGDVSQGREITLENFAWLLDGVLTPQQLEGMRLLLTPRPTLWFNRSEHRVTAHPVPGVSCFACHINGHTNGAAMLEPSVHPNLARVRLDTPSLRGAAQARLLGSKRQIKTLAEFTEVEDYFEGDKAHAETIGARPFSPEEAKAVEAMMAAIDFAPAAAVGKDGRLLPSVASKGALAGEALFHGKAKCATCHAPPFYADQKMHDLKVERLYSGRAEGPFKTPTLRGLKDSPPYLHDGRLPTVEDAVEFFDRVQALGLTPAEKTQLAEFLKTL